MVRGCSNWWQHVDNFWKFLNHAHSPLERKQTTHAYRKVYTNQAITVFWIGTAPGTTTETSANHSSPAIELQPLAELRRILELLLASWIGISCMHDVMTCQYLLTSVKFHWYLISQITWTNTASIFNTLPLVLDRELWFCLLFPETVAPLGV